MSHDPDQVRKRTSGGGRKRKLDQCPQMGALIEALLETAGPMKNPFFTWTTKGTEFLATELRKMELDVSRRVVAAYLHELGFFMTHARNLAAGRDHGDVREQFHFIVNSMQSQCETAGAVLFLEGAETALPSKQRYREEVHHDGPSEDMLLSDYSWEKFSPKPTLGVMPNPYAFREHIRPAVRDEIRQKARVPTKILLKDMKADPPQILITDRNAAIFTAMVLRDWWQCGTAFASGYTGTILLVTCGASPDIVFPRVWRWAMSRLSRELGIVISVCRVPPASWKFLGESWPLFSFTAQKETESPTQEGYLVKGRLAFRSCTEMNSIAAVFDHRRFPKHRRKVRDRTLKGMNIRLDGPYGDWDYSFIPDGGRE